MAGRWIWESRTGGIAVRGKTRSTLKTVPKLLHSTWNDKLLSLSCGEKPATTDLSTEQRIHTFILEYQPSFQKPQLYTLFVNQGTRSELTFFCADGHCKAHVVYSKELFLARPNSALGLPNVHVSRSHTHTHTHTHTQTEQNSPDRVISLIPTQQKTNTID
jgi:hypothetical protein